MSSPLPWTIIMLSGAGFLFLHPWLLMLVVLSYTMVIAISIAKASKPKARGYRVYNGHTQSFRQATAVG